MRNTKAARSFTFLTAFDSIIIPLLQGAFEGQKRGNHGWLPLPTGRRTYSTLNTEYQLTGVYSTALSVLIVYATFTEMSRTYDC